MQRNDDETITPPALQGEHGLLQRWASARMDGLENKFDTQLTRVHDIMAKQADRLAKIEGGEEARREWRDDVRRSLEQIQRAMVAIPAAAASNAATAILAAGCWAAGRVAIRVSFST